MAKTDQPKSIPTSYLRGDIPAEAMAKLQAAYQASGPSSSLGCPDPESVIDYAFEELTPEKRSEVHAHLSECKDCLALVLDLRSAWAEAETGKYIVRDSAPIHVQPQSWLAGLADGMRGLLSRLVPVPRLIPVAVALVVLAVSIGVLQHLKDTTSGQPPFTMTKVKQGTAYNYKVFAIEEVNKVSAVASIKVRTDLSFLPLLLRN
jgi:hypothetical protein